MVNGHEQTLRQLFSFDIQKLVHSDNRTMTTIRTGRVPENKNVR